MASLSTRTTGVLNPRNTYVRSNIPANFRQHYYKNGVLQSVGGLVKQSAGYKFDQFYGELIPNFHKRKNAGELLPMTAYKNYTFSCNYSGSREHFYVDYLGDEHRYKLVPVSPSNVYIPRPGGIPNPPTEGIRIPMSPSRMGADRGIDMRYLAQSAASKCYSAGWDGLTFAAELGKTVNMFRGIVQTLKGFGSLHGLINAWLQGRYGWRVLVYDIQDCNNYIKQLSKDSKLRVKERVGASASWSEDYSQDFEYGSNTTHVSYLIEHELSCRASIIADFIPPAISLNPIVTAWELVPYSFVLDWVFTVGTALNAISFGALQDQYTCAAGGYYTRTLSYDVTYTSKAPWTVIGQSHFDSELVLRDRRPIVVPYTPQYHLNLDFLKVADLLALLYKIFR